MGDRTLVVIHGVGDSPPGASLEEASLGLHADGVVAERADLLIDGLRYPRLRVHQHPEVAEIIEVNWSDVARPGRNPFSLADYCVRIVVALLQAATASGRPNRFGMAYRRAFEALLMFCIYPPLVSIAWTTATPGPGAYLLAGAAGIAVVGGLTAYLARYPGAFAAGWVWAAAIAAATVALAAGYMPVEAAVGAAASVYVGTQVLTGTLLLCALVEAACRWSLPLDRRIAAAALLYFPLFMMSAVGAILWVVALGTASQLSVPARFNHWQAVYARALSTMRYDLALVEFTFAALVGVVALGLLAVAAVYVHLDRSSEPLRSNAGEAARNGAKHVLTAGAVMFALLSLTYGGSAAASDEATVNSSVLQVYSISSLRFLPYLPLVMGPLAIAFGVIVDVLFYIAAVEPLSTAHVLRHRLRVALRYAHGRSHEPVVVAAHSQGTVIAIDVLGEAAVENRAVSLVTAGSPIASLYARFLGSTPESRAMSEGGAFAQPPSWINFSRNGDYIGAGQVRRDVLEVNLGRGGHTGYWREVELWRRVFGPQGTFLAGRG